MSVPTTKKKKSRILLYLQKPVDSPKIRASSKLVWFQPHSVKPKKMSVSPIYFFFFLVIQLGPAEDPKLLWAPNHFICRAEQYLQAW